MCDGSPTIAPGAMKVRSSRCRSTSDAPATASSRPTQINPHTAQSRLRNFSSLRCHSAKAIANTASMNGMTASSVQLK